MSRDIFVTANVLLPRNVEMKKYSVVACDQYTSQPEYWDQVREFVQGEMSTLHMIFPEADFKTADFDETIKRINATMSSCFSQGKFQEYRDCFIYVERKLKNGKIRKGIIGCVDLEEYDFSVGSTSAVRATEGTVLDRLPPRMKIRRNAPLELPHIMVLIDDAEKTVIEPVANRIKEYEKLYSFKLMQDSGSIKGYLIDKSEISRVLNALDKLFSEKERIKRYGSADLQSKLLYAVGDGNHSLATARNVYLDLKAEYGEEYARSHPARYALVELVNLHDESLEFEAIHRICTGVDVKKILQVFGEKYGISKEPISDGQYFDAVINGEKTRYYIKNPQKNIAVGSLQSMIDDYLSENGGECDYIHGENVVEELSKQQASIGFLLPCMDKDDLFPTVIKDGALPRKTFSMGEARDKRFYLEARKIK